jgi:hypothetical protein
MSEAAVLGFPLIINFLACEVNQLNLMRSPESWLFLLNTLPDCAVRAIPPAQTITIFAKFQGPSLVLPHLIAVLNRSNPALLSSPAGARRRRRTSRK